MVCDGTGYGMDGAIWGGECMIASLTEFERFGHLEYYPLVGADKASKEAIRPLLSLLRQAYGEEFRLEAFDWLLDRLETDEARARMVLEQIDRRINAVETSSLGRVFDAVAALLGLGHYNHFDAQLPMALESAIDPGVETCLAFGFDWDGKHPARINLHRMWPELIEQIRQGVDAGKLSTAFHNTLVEALWAMAVTAREKTKLDTVALSGGVFCNHYLINRLVKRLKETGFRVLWNRDVPANDGGIALGQAAIAASLLNDDAQVGCTNPCA
jgi:hydrogenase maturation protein HypF